MVGVSADGPIDFTFSLVLGINILQFVHYFMIIALLFFIVLLFLFLCDLESINAKNVTAYVQPLELSDFVLAFGQDI